MNETVLAILAFAAITIIGLLIWNLKRTIIQRDKRLDEGSQRMSNIEKDIHEIKESLPKDYIAKVDYKDDIKDVKDGIQDIRKYILENKK